MKLKTIKKILEAKHLDLCESIKDDNTRKLVRDHSIITGGSIVSMLLREKVNDFDFYFTNKETVLAVAKYYVDEFKKENGLDCEIRESEDRVSIFIPSAGVAGSIPQEESEAEDGQEETEEDKEKYRPIFLSENAITLTNRAQLVIRFYGQPETIHKNYDFIHCTNYWTPGGGLVTNKAALESILTKELKYVGSLYPLCSVIRTRKFIQRGWNINAGQYLKMCFQVSELDLTDINVLKEQLTGVDALYFYQLIKACQSKQESDPNFQLTAPYLSELVDRIFG